MMSGKITSLNLKAAFAIPACAIPPRNFVFSAMRSVRTSSYRAEVKESGDFKRRTHESVPRTDTIID
jgi:hypothetical protein